jgi:phosphoethanolamine N-methyltransferase
MGTKKNLRYLFWNASNNQALGSSLLKDPKWNHINVAEKEQIFSSILPPLDGLCVLELGGGIGRFTTDFASQAKEVTVVDLSEQALQENRERHQDFSNITYIVGSVTDIRFEQNSFDLIFSNWLLMYLNQEEITQLLNACLLWLRPEGMIFFHESCERNYAGHRIVRNWFTVEMIRTIFPFVGKPIYSIWNFKLPPLKDLWTAVKNFEKPQHFRQANFYEACFADNFQIVLAGHIAAYEKFFHNKLQRYWLLSPS